MLGSAEADAGATETGTARTYVAVAGSSRDTKRRSKLQARDRVEAVLRARESGR